MFRNEVAFMKMPKLTFSVSFFGYNEVFLKDLEFECFLKWNNGY